MDGESNDTMSNVEIDNFISYSKNETTVANVTYLSAFLPVAAYIAPTLFSLTLLVGLVGNALVIYVVARYSEMRTVTNYYIVNLAVTDLSFLVCCAPFTAANYTLPSWIFGRGLCKFSHYIQQVTAQATCITLCVLTVDRFCAIVYPIRSLGFRRKRVAVIANVATWLVSFLAALPVYLFHDLTKFYYYGWRTYCRPMFPSEGFQEGYMIFTILFTYFIPLIICTVTCSLVVKRLRSRFQESESRPQHLEAQTRRITRMVVGVVVVFMICWLPNHAINMWRYITIRSSIKRAMFYCKMVALFLIYCNSALNPFIYTLVGENFRHYLKQSIARPNSRSQTKTSSLGSKQGQSGAGVRRDKESSMDKEHRVANQDEDVAIKGPVDLMVDVGNPPGEEVVELCDNV